MYKQLTHVEAEELMAQHEIIVADVRDEDSYAEGHIPDAMHLSMSVLQEFIAASDKNIPVLVYCYHGISSQSVAQHLVDQGFKEVYSLVGGIEKWAEFHPTSQKQD